jgi:hypothetical protein
MGLARNRDYLDRDPITGFAKALAADAMVESRMDAVTKVREDEPKQQKP